jgi:Protein of unknown function (DUF2490)
LKLKLIIFAFFCVLAGEISAQRQVFFQQTYWTRVYLQKKMKHDLSVHYEIDNRRFFTPSRQHQFITHLHLHKKLKKGYDLGFGSTYSKVLSQNPLKTSPIAVPEFRLFQEITKDIQFTPKLKFNPRIRIEERFFRNTDGVSLTSGFRYATRLRGRLSLQYPLKTGLLMKIGDEIMFQFAKNATTTFDTNRLFGGFEQKISKHFSGEIFYIWSVQQKQNTEIFYNRDILRCTIYGKF